MIKLKKIYISSFGKLKNFTLDFTDGLNEIREENGYGKSTVAAFVKAMFFGFGKGGSRSVAENARKKYTPWQSDGKFGGYVVFDKDGKRYKASRYFGKTSASDEFSLYDGDDKPCGDYGEDLGETLFDISADGFERCLYIPQNGIEVKAGDSIRKKLHRLVEDTDDSGDYLAASKRLEDYKNSLISAGRTRNLSEKAKAEAALEEARREMWAAVHAGQEAEALEVAARQNDDEARQLRQRLAAIKQKQKAADEQRAVDMGKREAERRAKEQFDRAVRRRDALLEKHADVDDGYVAALKSKTDRYYAAKEKVAASRVQSGGSGGRFAVVAAVCALLVVISAVVAVVAADTLGTVGVLALAAVALAAICVAAVTYCREKAKKHACEKRYAEMRQAEETCLMLEKELKNRFAAHKIYEDNFYASLTTLARDRADLKAALEEMRLMDGQGTEKADILAEDYREEIVALEKRLSDIVYNGGVMREKCRVLREKADGAKDISVRQAACEDAVAEAERKAALVMKAAECLTKAKENLSKAFMPAIRAAFERYISDITGGRFNGAAVDDEFQLRLEEKGDKRDFGYFSKGIADLSMFCLRLALIDVMYGDDAPFLLLDDPFVNLDEDNLDGAKAIIKRRAEKSQVIYFTCRG